MISASTLKEFISNVVPLEIPLNQEDGSNLLKVLNDVKDQIQKDLIEKIKKNDFLNQKSLIQKINVNAFDKKMLFFMLKQPNISQFFDFENNFNINNFSNSHFFLSVDILNNRFIVVFAHDWMDGNVLRRMKVKSLEEFLKDNRITELQKCISSKENKEIKKQINKEKLTNHWWNKELYLDFLTDFVKDKALNYLNEYLKSILNEELQEKYSDFILVENKFETFKDNSIYLVKEKDNQNFLCIKKNEIEKKLNEENIESAHGFLSDRLLLSFYSLKNNENIYMNLVLTDVFYKKDGKIKKDKEIDLYFLDKKIF